MRPVLDRVDPSKPQIHALIIGVGHYPHLLGGDLFQRAGVVGSIARSKLGSPPISSSTVRERIRAGEPIDDLVPSDVARLIEERGLYRNRG